MADMMQFDLVSPEKPVASYKASAVRIPGSVGDLTAMADHVPTVVNLRPGVLHVEGEDGEHEYVVTGGFAQVTPDKVTVLAEESHHRDNMTQEMLDRMIEEAAQKRQRVEEQADHPGPVDDAEKLLRDMMAMGTHIGLDPKQPNF